MAIVTIKIVDENPQRYTLKPNTRCLGRMYDNIAEGIQVLFPSYELTNGSSCTMIVYANGTQIDSISVSNGVPFDIRDNLSQYKDVNIGFIFEKADGYTKNSEAQCFYFADALKPIAFTPSDPTQHDQINFLLGNAFVDVKWSETERNTLDFLNLSGGIVQSIELSPFVQEQADLAETDIDSDSYVKNKSTIYLTNEGSNGTSPYAEIADLPTKTSDLQNDGDGESPFATQLYVDTYGGKIDELYLNDVYQQIIDKKVYLTVDKNTVGLGNVDNTSDINKPVSTAQQSAIDAVANSIGNGQITITQGGTTKGTFTVNQSGNTTIALDAGGGSGTGNYPDLTNLPQINSITLVGNLSSSDLGLATAAQGALAGTALQPSDVDSALNTSSANPVQNKVLAVLIPSDASDLNPLATQNFVNSSIATNTANFIGTFASVIDLNAYIGTITNNDYAFVVNSVITDNGSDWATFADLDNYDKTLLTEFDYAWVVNDSKFDLYRFNIITQTWSLRASHINKDSSLLNTAYNRYKAVVSGGTTTWEYEYTLNNSSFTASQWATINSGLTSDDKTKLDGIEAGAQVNTVTSVNSKTGAVVLTYSDVGAEASFSKNTAFNKNFETSTSNIKMDGTVSVGSLDTLARADHIHPSDTSKVDILTTIAGIDLQDDITKSELLTALNVADGANVTSISGSGTPTTSTAADYIGQIYLDTTHNLTYICMAIASDGATPPTYTYTWKMLFTNYDEWENTTAQNNVGILSTNCRSNGVSIGSGSKAGFGVAIGANADADADFATAVGWNSKAAVRGVALGKDAQAGTDAIQIGTGHNSTANTFSVGFRTVNYQMLNNKGKIPQERFSDCLSGSSAPTSSTVADYVGQLYKDTTNDKLYICETITEDTSTTPSTFTYTWTQLIRATDKASAAKFGIVRNQYEGISGIGIYQGDLYVTGASQAGIAARSSQFGSGYGAIIPSNLNYAVKAALTDANHLTMTATEQTTAQEVLGLEFGLLRWSD